ncbi:hypothetical protein BDF21DRAFT_412704 [Thamnidium elegans]|nr:hypothetical protein BDF21DRAFT_412704 [Thamnidium elegans]
MRSHMHRSLCHMIQVAHRRPCWNYGNSRCRCCCCHLCRSWSSNGYSRRGCWCCQCRCSGWWCLDGGYHCGSIRWRSDWCCFSFGHIIGMMIIKVIKKKREKKEKERKR